jgi:hypothetical protein
MMIVKNRWNLSLSLLLVILLVPVSSAFGQIKPEEISGRDQFEEAVSQIEDQLDSAEDDEAVLSTLVNIIALKCYFPLEDYEDLHQVVRQKKISASTPDVRFAAATVSKFLLLDISPARGREFLAIKDRSAMFEKIAELLY